MTGNSRRAGRLSRRIMRVTLLIGAVTVLAAGSVALMGVSRFASRQIEARDTVFLHVLEDGILTRLQMAEALASRAAAALADADTKSPVSDRLATITEASSGLISEILVVDTSGKVVASTPSARTTLSPDNVGAFRDALRGVAGFSRAEGSPRPSDLWLTRAVLLSGQRPVIILMRVDSRFLSRIIEAATAVPGRAVIVVEGSRLLASTGDVTGLEIASARWEPNDAGSAHVTVPRAGLGPMQGYYNSVEGFEGIEWRLAVMEPDLAGMADTTRAITPSLLVLALGGVVALITAWILSRALVEPLRDLEEAAYRAANGSYVKPLPEDRDDEIGQVAKAFNAVALRLNALHDLSQLLASASQLDQVLDGILSSMGHLVGPGTAAVYLLDTGGRWLLPVRVRGADIADVGAVDAFSDGWLANSLADTEPVVYPADPQRITEELPGLGVAGSSALVAPLIAGHETLGAVVVLLDSEAETTQAEREMVRTFSAQAAVAVQNSRLFEVETESRRVSEGLRRIAERLARPEGFSASLPDVEHIVAGLFSAEKASFAFVDRRALGMQPSDEPQADSRLFDLAMRGVSPGHPSVPVALGSGEDPDVDALLAGSTAQQLLLIPVAVDREAGAVIGLWLPQPAERRPDMGLAASVANELALAFENAYLYDQAVSKAMNLETIFRISQAVGSSLQVNVVLNRVLDVVQKILSADALALMTYDQRRKTISTAMARGAVSPDLMDRVFTPSEDVPGYVFTAGVPATYRDLHEGMGGIAGDAAKHGLRSLLAVPLLARGRSIGVLTVFSSETAAFTEEDANTLQTFASQAALAIDTARLYSREHEVATILQRSIIPGALPEFPEVEAGSVYVPAGGDAEIGGDYYDVFKSADGGIVFAIADVCGKGVVAATKTSMIKYSVRSLAAAGLSPSGILREVNRMVTESGDLSDIVTLWVGVYDPHRGRLTWASGGHPAGLILRAAGGEQELLAPTGPLLGALSDVDYAEETVPLDPGDTVLLYTDGVTEARNGNSFFGEARVRSALERGGTAEEVAHGLLISVRRFVRGELRDDVAVLVLRVRKTDGTTDTMQERRGDEAGV